MKKVLIITGFVMFLLFAIILVCLWGMFGTKITVAKSVAKLEDGLYSLEYSGDYGFDEFLEQGGAASDMEMAEYITKFLSNGFVSTASGSLENNFGCSTLSVENCDGQQLMGRNFDWNDCNAMIVHTKPEQGYESFSTSCLDFLGFGDGWKPEGIKNQYMALAAIYVPLDGMNEKGLCVADLISGDEEEIHQNTGKPDLTIVSSIRLLLDKAATVEEAVSLLKEYDLNSSIGTSHHLAVSDARGKSVVIEYIDDKMIVTETDVVTNHYLSPGEKYGIGNGQSHSRYEALTEMREQAGGIMSSVELMNCLKAVSYDGITQWSIVYDKTNLNVDYYWKRGYEHPYHFEIQ